MRSQVIQIPIDASYDVMTRKDIVLQYTCFFVIHRLLIPRLVFFWQKLSERLPLDPSDLPQKYFNSMHLRDSSKMEKTRRKFLNL